MFHGDRRPTSALSELSRSGERVVYGWHPWSWVIVVGALAVITSPFWLFFPPKSPERIRGIGLGAIAVLGALAAVIGRACGPRLVIDLADKSASWTDRNPLGSKLVWSLQSPHAREVSVRVDPDGVATVQVACADGRTIVVDRGLNESDLRALAADLAACWGVPLKP